MASVELQRTYKVRAAAGVLAYVLDMDPDDTDSPEELAFWGGLRAVLLAHAKAVGDISPCMAHTVPYAAEEQVTFWASHEALGWFYPYLAGLFLAQAEGFDSTGFATPTGEYQLAMNAWDLAHQITLALQG